MSNKLIGKLYEKRGNDVFEVVVDPSGDVVGVTQYEQGRLRFQRIDFFVESVPELVTLLQKAAGIPAEDYEYKVQHRDLDSQFGGWSDSGLWKWVDEESAVRRFEAYVEDERRMAEETGSKGFAYRVIRRPKGSETVYRSEETNE